jgi:hypothetical protein
MHIALLSIGSTIPAYQEISVAMNVADVGGRDLMLPLKGKQATKHNIADAG